MVKSPFRRNRTRIRTAEITFMFKVSSSFFTVDRLEAAARSKNRFVISAPKSLVLVVDFRGKTFRIETEHKRYH